MQFPLSGDLNILTESAAIVCDVKQSSAVKVLMHIWKQWATFSFTYYQSSFHFQDWKCYDILGFRYLSDESEVTASITDSF